MIDLPTIEGTASSRLPWGLLLLARFCAHRWQEKLGVCTSLARKAWCVHIAGKKSLVCAHRWQEKLGVCTSLARSALIDLPTIEGTASSRLPWGLLLLARLGDDHSIELQPGPLGSMVVHHANRLGDDRFADHRGNCIESPPVGIAAGPARR
jgi:hypothetical protein